MTATNDIEVWDGAGARYAVPGPSAASAELLTLLGFESEPTLEKAPSSLGDALAALVARLALVQQQKVLACGDVANTQDGRYRLGEVLPAGDIDALCAAARGAPNRLTVVADGDGPKESMAARLRSTLEGSQNPPVMGVLTLGEAAERLLGLRELALAGSLVPPAGRERSRQALFEGTLLGSRLGWDWGLVSAVASGLLRHVGDKDDERFELEMVRDIARRHGGTTAPIGWPEEDQLQRYDSQRQLTILAHVVQSVADGDLGAVPGHALRGLAAVGEQRSVEALKLLGAIGRALAAVGEFDAAKNALDNALEGWLVTSPVEGSHALSELLRIEGIRGNLAGVVALRTLADEKIVPDLDAASKPYVALAVGRALAQAGHPQEALEVLADETLGARAPLHVQTSAQRWRAVAARSLQKADQADEALRKLDGLGDTDQRILARLDNEALDVLETKKCLDELLLRPRDGEEARRLLSRLAPGLSTYAIAERADVVRRFRAESRY